MVILLNINITYSNVIAWYDITWDMIYYMIYDCDIWYQIWYDIRYGTVVFRGGRQSAPPLLGQYIHVWKTRWPPQAYLEQSSPLPPPIDQIVDLPMYGMVCFFIILKYPILQQQLWQCYNFRNLPSSPGLHTVMCCNCFSYAYKYM